MSDEPYIPFYKPYGMSDEEYQHEVRIAEQKHNEWEEGQHEEWQRRMFEQATIDYGYNSSPFKG